MSAQKGRPPTPAQRHARRRNGQQSTGPRTPMGKKIVSLNAVKHGMYSCPPIQTVAVLGENPIAYIKLLTGPCRHAGRGGGGERRPCSKPWKSPWRAGTKRGGENGGQPVSPASEPSPGDAQVAEIGPLETSNFQKQSHQVVENIM